MELLEQNSINKYHRCLYTQKDLTSFRPISDLVLHEKSVLTALFPILIDSKHIHRAQGKQKLSKTDHHLCEVRIVSDFNVMTNYVGTSISNVVSTI